MRRRPIAISAALAVLAGGLTVAMSGTTASAAAVVRDGRAPERAAATCYAIKRLRPASPSGIYWLQTPRLVAPQQFYCDQVTEGGGWVLIGRGREGWSFAHNGQGSAKTLRTVVTGPGAFAPKALPAATIEGLLNGQGVHTLADGLRVRRTLDAAGTRWQEMRWKFAPLPRWSWAFGGALPLQAVTQDGRVHTGGYNTRDWSVAGDDARRWFTSEWRSHNFQAGFSFGSGVVGSSSPTSHLWQYGTENSAIPFTQLWLRPTSTNPAYPAVPSSGLSARRISPLMGTTTSTATPWGVTGVTGGGTGELNIEVQALTPIGGTMYVGGKFEYVQKGRTPAAGEKIRQPYLAAFDIATGAWKPAFRPRLDGQVWDLQAGPGGSLLAAGEFTSASGVAGTSGLVALDPATGAVRPGFRASVTSPLGVKVRALDVQDGWLYLGGSFQSVSGGTPSATVSVRNAARVRLTDGRPDGVWRPRFTSTVIELDASSRGDRVYLAGHFGRNGDPNFIQASKVAVLSTAGSGALVPGLQEHVPVTTDVNKQYQQVIREFGDSVWQGGSQHVLQKYSRTDYALQRSSITLRGGDFQAAVKIGGIVYAACHCDKYVYSGAKVYAGGQLPPAYSRVDPIVFIGAWNARTGDYLPEFAVTGLGSREGNGPWDLAYDGKCMWFGGDMVRGTVRNGSAQWLGGFGKVCNRDTTTPTKPGYLRAARTSAGVALSWGSSTDGSGKVMYEVLRGDRVIRTVTTRSYTDVAGTAGTRYWVRARDAGGNRSATTSVAVAS